MARTPQVPGAAKTTAAAKAAAAAQEAAALEQQQNESSAVSEPVQQVNQSEQEQAAPDQDDRLDQILKGQSRIEAKLDRLLRQGAGAPTSSKKQRWVQGKNGLELQEV